MIIKNGIIIFSYIFVYGNFDIYFEFGIILLENLFGVIYFIYININYRY